MAESPNHELGTAGAQDPLFQALQQRLADKGQLAGVSDAQLTRMTDTLHEAGFQPQGRWDATLVRGVFYAAATDVAHAGHRVKLDLSAPPPARTAEPQSEEAHTQASSPTRGPTP